MSTPVNQEQEKELSSRKVFLISCSAAVLLYLLDQLTKIIIVSSMKLYESIPVIDGFFNIVSVRNRGAAWGIFHGKQWFLLLIAFLALLAVVFFFRKLTDHFKERIFALFLLCSGILGNCTDRLFRNEVVDFLDFHLGDYHWPAFNVADICICVGVGIFVISSLLRPEPEEEKKEKTEVK